MAGYARFCRSEQGVGVTYTLTMLDGTGRDIGSGVVNCLSDRRAIANAAHVLQSNPRPAAVQVLDNGRLVRTVKRT